MQKQLEEAVMQALHTGPFKGRRFFMDPKLDEPTHFRMDYSWRRVNFSIEGDPIQGLHLGVVMARDWTFFIPEGPERLAIKRAIDLESAQVEQEKYHARDPARGIVCELRARFEESLSAIAM